MAEDLIDTVDVIYCIGDSHVSFFSGENSVQQKWPARSADRILSFRTFRLGAVLAYNLCETGTSMQGREKLFDVLNQAVPRGSRIVLSFGEIDCRAHLLKQSQLQQKSIEEMVAECVDRYFSVIFEVINLGYEILIWNVIPSTRIEIINNPEFPTYGSSKERNHVTRIFNDMLSSRCKMYGVVFIDVFDRLLSKDGLPDMSYYMDEIHLSQRAMPFVIETIRENVAVTINLK